MKMEIEAKIPVNEKEVENITQKFKQSNTCTPVFKEDLYLKMEGSLLRIRKENDQYYLTYKVKSTENGIETNKEEEVEGTAIKALYGFVKNEHPELILFTKTKEGLSANFCLKGIVLRAELLTINKKCTYLEIESKDQSSNLTPFIQKTLEWTFKEEFKLDWEKRDSRSWKEIIESDKKN